MGKRYREVAGPGSAGIEHGSTPRNTSISAVLPEIIHRRMAHKVFRLGIFVGSPSDDHRQAVWAGWQFVGRKLASKVVSRSEGAVMRHSDFLGKSSLSGLAG